MLHKFLARSIQASSEMNKLYVTISARVIPDGHAVIYREYIGIMEYTMETIHILGYIRVILGL